LTFESTVIAVGPLLAPFLSLLVSRVRAQGEEEAPRKTRFGWFGF
jgi:hypothetical protein